MLYHVLHIKTAFAEEWQKDLFDQQICELGVDTIDQNDYYIQSDTWERVQKQIETLCANSTGATLIEAEACEDKNWNETWELDHSIEELPLGIRIVPHCAFGAGHHETTAMMIEALMNFKCQISDFKFKVLDHGTGTGVLAIFAKRLGATHVLAIDIDEKSVINAQENAAINGEEIEVRLGDRIPEDAGAFDLILANIHRNILLANMALYAAHLKQGGQVWLSGFYDTDCEVLIQAANAKGLAPIATHANHEWRMIQLQKSSNR